MKRITSFAVACTALLAVASFVATSEARTPLPNGAYTKTRVFNDCPTSTVTVTNNYPALLSIEDSNIDCSGFANRHIWRFSENGGVNAADFDNHSSFRVETDLVISGTGNGEAGLSVAVWFANETDGSFNVRTPDGEIAAFGGRLPFYSFSNAPHNLRYAAGETIHLEVIYEPHGVKPSATGTIEYRVTYQGNSYTSGQLPFNEGNVAEGPIYGNWGILNKARVGGYFQPRLGNGTAVNVKATFTDIAFESAPDPTSAITKTRIFNDCPTSTVTVTNNYPGLISIKDEIDCNGFANLHNWSFSEDGVNAVEFNNNSQFNFSADLTISGTGNGEAGLRISPWYSKDADGRFNVRSSDGEIACFGGRLPFYSFSNAPHNLRYAKGEPIHLDIKVYAHSQVAGDPAEISYTLIYKGVGYTSGSLPFDGANPSEEPPYGQFGILNDARAGGYFQAFLDHGNAVSCQADWRNIRYDECLERVAVAADVSPSRVNRNAHGGSFTATLYPLPPYTASNIDPSTVRLNGVPGTNPKIVSHGEGLRMKFKRADVVATLPVSSSKVPVLFSGEIGAVCFEALEFIYVKEPKPADTDDDDDNLAPGQVVNVLWQVPTEQSIPKVSLLKSLDNGETWSIEVKDLSNDGSYKWTVPNTPTRQGRLSIVVLGQADEFGLVTQSEIAETGLFSILGATGVDGSGDVSFAIRGVMPNPARGPLNVSFSLPSREPATIGVFDVSGRQVALRDVSDLGAGRHTVTLGARAGLRPGVYMVRLTQGKRSVSTRAVVIE